MIPLLPPPSWGTAAGTVFRRFRREQAMLLHHAVEALMANQVQPDQAACPVHQCAGTTVAIGWQSRNFGAYRFDQHRIRPRINPGSCAAIDPFARPVRAFMDMRTPHPREAQQTVFIGRPCRTRVRAT
jgi:hypothetical protein